jgi:hypothetical protein
MNFSRYLGIDSGFNHDIDMGRDVAVDSAGYMYITGSMEVVILSPGGDEITAYNLSDSEGGYGIAVDNFANIYVSGSEALGVVKLNPGGSLAYHTTGLGGTGFDIAVEPSGYAYVVGAMGMVRLDPTGVVIGTTPLNGVGYSIAYQDGHLYVAGFTSSSSFPATSGAYDTTYNFSGDAFIAKLTTDGNLIYASYLGGILFDIARGIAVDSAGNAYLTGYTFSEDFPISANTLDGSLTGLGDAFLIVLKPGGAGGNDLLFSTFLGGNDPAVSPYLTPDRMFAIALDEEGFVYLAGEAGSYDFPISQTEPVNGFSDLVVMKLSVGEYLQNNIYLPLIFR